MIEIQSQLCQSSSGPAPLVRCGSSIPLRCIYLPTSQRKQCVLNSQIAWSASLALMQGMALTMFLIYGPVFTYVIYKRQYLHPMGINIKHLGQCLAGSVLRVLAVEKYGSCWLPSPLPSQHPEHAGHSHSLSSTEELSSGQNSQPWKALVQFK